MAMLEELKEAGRCTLVFSQFTSMLSIIEDACKSAGIGYVKLTGQTVKREAVIEKFQSGAVPVFLISLKAGGVGLNLTQADTVIHYDPWWNPAAENQATDRAHRIGQKKNVMVYKLVAESTLEEPDSRDATAKTEAHRLRAQGGRPHAFGGRGLAGSVSEPLIRRLALPQTASACSSKPAELAPGSKRLSDPQWHSQGYSPHRLWLAA